MPSDQLFKELLTAFFFEFLRLFFPAIADAIDPATLTQRNPEVFTDLPGGRLRRADTVFEAPLRTGPYRAVLLHVETQAEREEEIATRMWQYNTGLEARTGLPVISILLALYRGTRGISLEHDTRELFGATYQRLTYWLVGLRDLDAATYLHSDSPLVTALAALMRSGPGGRPALKIALIRRVRASTIDRARLSLIVNVIETYLKLDPDEVRAFREQLRVEGDEALETTELTWADEMMQIGMERGREQGIAQGALAAKREIALVQYRARFGQPDGALQARIEAADNQTLDRLLEQLMLATSPAEVIAVLG